MNPRRLLYILVATLLTLAVTDSPQIFASSSETEAAASSSAPRKKSKRKSSRKSSRKKSSYRSRNKKRTSTRRKSSRPAAKTPKKEQPQNDSLTLQVNKALLDWIPANLNPGGLRVNSVKPDKSRRYAVVNLNEHFTYLPVTRELIDSLSSHVSKALPDSLAGFRVGLNVGNKSLAYYITKVDKLPQQHRTNPAFVTERNPMVRPTKGMDHDIVALWHSHGRYYKPGSGAWMWQRPLLFQTVEDTYTMGYILPFVTPMVENAGAYVMLPRERDTNRNEVIVDNDTNDEGRIYSQPYYREKSGATHWSTGELEGFIYDLPDFRDTENPFENGTYRQTTTQKGGTPSVAAWYADIPEDGEYAVYVSYKTLPNSTADAHYTVNYSGGSKEFTVNQQMGGGTWIYLGTFPLESGYSDTEPIVTLTNETDGTPGTIVPADAVKIGGGMGNIARPARRSDIYYDPSTPIEPDCDESENAEEEDGESEEDDTESADETVAENEDQFDNADAKENTPEEKTPAANPAEKRGPAPVFRTSGYPRFLEGARYWLHWAGFPEYVYSPYHGSDDYKDDYTSRGNWVNHLAGGSRVLPGQRGLNIPVDVALALHSDAGKKSDDSFVGTLGIYFTNNGDSYRDATPRINSRMLTDIVMQQITNDIRRQFEPQWVRRSMWDKSYVEARVPEVPTTLIELMSHQNFADMQYGLDPAFRFTVGRAIYKGLARFLAERKDRQLVIQPLPVKNFAIRRTGRQKYRLSWEPTPDRLEPTAVPTKYIIMERTADLLGFNKIAETTSTHYDLKVADDDIHSFRVIAANEGGVSFPSETLAMRDVPNDSKPVLIVNGFSRVSAPGHYSAGNEAGFNSDTDFGVPYIKDISFTGYQTEFRRSAGDGFGRSGSNYATTVIAGNTFDYPYVHGEAIADAGRGFVSASAGAVENGDVKLTDYNTVDLILGKQRRTVTGTGKSGIRFHTFPTALKNALRQFSDKGGHLIVSGQYVASSLTDMRSDAEDRTFAAEILGVTSTESDLRRSGRVRLPSGKNAGYSATLNDRQYIVEAPDILQPAEGADTETILTFSDTGTIAGIRHDRGGKRGDVTVLSIPLESLLDTAVRSQLMKSLLRQ